jgi:hypothetical protein
MKPAIFGGHSPPCDKEFLLRLGLLFSTTNLPVTFFLAQRFDAIYRRNVNKKKTKGVFILAIYCSISYKNPNHLQQADRAKL